MTKLKEHEKLIQELMESSTPKTERERAAGLEIRECRRNLKQIDELLARRPALNDCASRIERIDKALAQAAKAEKLEIEIKKLRVNDDTRS